MSNNENLESLEIGSEPLLLQEIVTRENKINKKENVLECLFNTDKQANYQVWSDNKDFGDITEKTDIYNSDKEFVPEPLKGLKEKKIMWDFIRNPSTDLNQIKNRQDLLESMKESGLLEQITSLKNGSYLIDQGIEGLFSLVRVSYDEELPLLDAYRNGDLSFEDNVITHLQEIKEGKTKLAKLVKTFSEIDEPIVRDVKNILKQDLKKIKFFNDDYFLRENYDYRKTLRLNNMVCKHILYFGSIVEFSNIITKDKYSRAEFNNAKSAEYTQGWNFIREKNGKNPQVLNDSVKDSSITILCGTNMGGKSFHMEQNHYIQLLAQSFGFVPAERGNFRVYDSFLYLDRAATEASHDLSAFGVEINHWTSALEKIKTNSKVFMCVDEGFSTTSAEDQYYLLMGVAEHLKKYQGKTLLSTHNELFIENYVNDSKVGIFNFPFTIEDNTKIKYSYKLTEGVGDSRALEVAESMGLSKKIIELAKKNIEGIFEKVVPKEDKQWKNIESYSEEERSQMKNGKYESLFGVASTAKDKIFQLFSQDRDFKYSISTGEDYKNISFGGWYVYSTEIRKSLISRLLIENKKIKTQDIIERQKMFSELSKSDRYQEIKEMGDKILYALKFLPKFSQIKNEFLTFNTVFSPNMYTYNPEKNLEYHIMFLSLNQKILGKDFPEKYNKLFEKMKEEEELLAVLDRYFKYQDIFEIPNIESAETKKEFNDVANKYETQDVKDKWQGKICIQRITELIDHLKTKDENFFYREICSLADLADNISYFQNELNIKDIELRIMICNLLDIKNVESQEINYLLVQNLLTDTFESFYKEHQLPGRSIFECDLKIIAPEIKFFTEYFKKKYEGDDLDYYNKWPNKLVLSLVLEMFVEKNSFEEFTNLLKSYDSVFLHQLANEIETKFKDFLPKIKEERSFLKKPNMKQIDLIIKDIQESKKYFRENKQNLIHLCSKDELNKIDQELKDGSNKLFIDLIKKFTIASPERVFNFLNTVYENEIKEILDDYNELENLYEQNSSYFKTKNDDYETVYLKSILNNPDLDNAYLKVRKFIEKYKIVFKDRNGNDVTERKLPEIKAGNLFSLREEVFNRNTKAIDLIIENQYDWNGNKEKELYKLVFEAQSLGLFGHMINTEGYNQVKFNSDGLVDIKEMFSVFKPKNKQELNDAHFGQDEQIRLIAAANMSGKTFYLKTLNMAILSGLNTGFVPAESATMPLFDNVVYLDRMTANLDGNLSALGNEVELWKSLFSVFENDQKVFVTAFIDEAFSTTSPRYQASLVYATVMEMISRGQYMAIASHNHDVLNLLRNLEKEFLKAYTLKINIDEKGKVEFKHKLRELKTEEKSFSEAIPVARTLGMPEEILQTAEKIRNMTINY